MRPIKLTMTAFGSYADTTEIPFSDLKNGLFLVTGDTGAGKTTIFDAIVFALYGELCGAEREDRKPEMMHSDFVEKSTDTVVTLVFSEGGKEYKAERTIHFQKKRGTEGGYGAPKISAVLSEPGKDPIQGATAVTNRVRELLGMDADQFRKIVMLAQGEFNKFLKAGSDDKNKILRELFDNRLYEYYTELLKAAKEKLKNAREDRSREIEDTLTKFFNMPEELTGEQKLLFHSGHPNLCGNLEKLIGEEEAAAEKLTAEAEAAQEALNALNQKQGAAAELGRRFDELKEKNEHLAELEGQKADFEARKAAYACAEAALHRALPVIREKKLADKAFADNEARIKSLTRSLEELLAVREAARAEKDGDAEHKKRAEALRGMIGQIKDQLPLYDELDKERAAKSKSLALAEDAGKEIAAKTETVEKTEAYIREHKEKLEALYGIDGIVSESKTAAEKAEDVRVRFAGRGGLLEKLRDIGTREKSLAEARAARQTAALTASEEMAAYNSVYQRFISGQAGILAEELRTKIERDGSTPCPVCGALRHREDVLHFAVKGEDIPDQEAVEAAKTGYERAEQARAKADRDVGSLEADIDGRKAAVLEAAEALFGEEMSYETLASREYLAEKQAALKAAAKNAEDAYREVHAAKTRRDRLKDEAEKAEAELPKLREAIRLAEGRKADESSAAAAAGAREESLKAQLLHADRDEARRVMRQLAEEEKVLSDAVRRHEAAFEEAEKRYADARGQLTAREDQRKALKESLLRAEEHLSGVLSELHFPDEAAVLAALPPVETGRQERWLKDERRAITEYENDCTNTAGRIRELAEALAGKERTDLEALRKKIDEAGELLARKNEEMNGKKSLVTNHQMTLKRVRAHKNYLDRTEEAWKRVNRLGSLAEGEKSEGGKISFDRYVIGAVFREILQMANRRLDIMSGGRYRLIYKSGVKRTNSEAGLEISVLDLSTGRERDSNSLSGGESFFTSLALALGLSDVVQNHAGGRRLETLFVDEGFGTLSDDVLDLALSVLKSLSEGNRMVGLISHVDKLNESIPQKIHVKNGKKGSTVRVETA